MIKPTSPDSNEDHWTLYDIWKTPARLLNQRTFMHFSNLPVHKHLNIYVFKRETQIKKTEL